MYTNSGQIDHVQDILNEMGIRQHKFTYREDNDERQGLLTNFDKGEIDALVAMRCLDEGVDVPSTKQAILMSNTGNPMQFIQRRGRVLRKSLQEIDDGGGRARTSEIRRRSGLSRSDVKYRHQSLEDKNLIKIPKRPASLEKPC